MRNNNLILQLTCILYIYIYLYIYITCNVLSSSLVGCFAHGCLKGCGNCNEARRKKADKKICHLKGSVGCREHVVWCLFSDACPPCCHASGTEDCTSSCVNMQTAASPQFVHRITHFSPYRYSIACFCLLLQNILYWFFFIYKLLVSAMGHPCLFPLSTYALAKCLCLETTTVPSKHPGSNMMVPIISLLLLNQ